MRRSLDAFLGIFDFSYQHYALGDLLTNQVNLAIMAIEQGHCRGRHHRYGQSRAAVGAPAEVRHARQLHRPSRQHYAGLRVQSIVAVIAAGSRRPDVQFSDCVASPKPHADVAGPQDASQDAAGFSDRPPPHINAFHARHGHIPELSAPRGYEGWARRIFTLRNWADVHSSSSIRVKAR